MWTDNHTNIMRLADTPQTILWGVSHPWLQMADRIRQKSRRPTEVTCVESVSSIHIVSICVIHHHVPIRIHEVKVTQGCERPYQLAKDGACVSGWTTRAKSLCKTPRVHNIALFSKTKTRNILKFKSAFPLPSFYFNL